MDDRFDEGTGAGCLGVAGGSAAIFALSLAIAWKCGWRWGLGFYLSTCAVAGAALVALASRE